MSNPLTVNVDPPTSDSTAVSPLASPASAPAGTASGAFLSPSASRVSFHSSTSPTVRRQPSGVTAAVKRLREREPEPESSGDETTAIINRERGGHRSYNTQNGRSSGSDIRPRQSSAKPRPQGQDGPEDSQGSDKDQPLTGWRKFVEKYGSVELENKGSVARDHLALERTFLAWLRTSLSFASIGIAITQLFRLNTTINQNTPTKEQLKLRHVGKPLGATFLAVGVLTLLVGFHRYFESQHYVIQGKFPASRGSVIIIAFCSAALIIASFVVVLVFANHSVNGN